MHQWPIAGPWLANDGRQGQHGESATTVLGSGNPHKVLLTASVQGQVLLHRQYKKMRTILLDGCPNVPQEDGTVQVPVQVPHQRQVE